MARHPISQQTATLLSSIIKSGSVPDHSLASILARNIVGKALRETLGVGKETDEAIRARQFRGRNR